jgi:hypothetical protein
MQTTSIFSRVSGLSIMRLPLLIALLLLAGCRPTVEFSSSTSAINSGESFELSWSVDFANGSGGRKITISPDIGTVEDEEGELTVTNLTKTTTYEIKVKASVFGFPVSASEKVTVTVDDSIETLSFLPPVEQSGWDAGFVGHDIDDQDNIGFGHAINDLTIDSVSYLNAYELSAEAATGNLFLFISQPYADANGILAANTSYTVGYEIVYAARALKGCGEGDNLPENAWLKVAALTEEPEISTSDDGQVVPNFDLGDPAEATAQVYQLGQVAFSGSDCSAPKLQRAVISNISNPISVKTDDNGQLWLLMGFHSSYQGELEFHILSAKVQIKD